MASQRRLGGPQVVVPSLPSAVTAEAIWGMPKIRKTSPRDQVMMTAQHQQPLFEGWGDPAMPLAPDPMLYSMHAGPSAPQALWGQPSEQLPRTTDGLLEGWAPSGGDTGADASGAQGKRERRQPSEDEEVPMTKRAKGQAKTTRKAAPTRAPATLPSNVMTASSSEECDVTTAAEALAYMFPPRSDKAPSDPVDHSSSPSGSSMVIVQARKPSRKVQKPAPGRPRPQLAKKSNARGNGRAKSTSEEALADRRHTSSSSPPSDDRAGPSTARQVDHGRPRPHIVLPAPDTGRASPPHTTFFAIGSTNSRVIDQPAFIGKSFAPGSLAVPPGLSPRQLAKVGSSRSSSLTPQPDTDGPDGSMGATTEADDDPPFVPPRAVDADANVQRSQRLRRAPKRFSDTDSSTFRRRSGKSRETSFSNYTTDQETEADVPLASVQRVRDPSGASKQRETGSANETRAVDDLPEPPLPSFESVIGPDGMLLDGLSWRLQSGTCSARLRGPTYAMSRCASCTSRIPGFVCSWINFRAWVHDDRSGDIVAGPGYGVAVVPSPKKQEAPDLPTTFNRSVRLDDLDELRRVIAPVLRGPLEADVKFASSTKCIAAPHELGFRLECDGCQATIVSAAWMCRHCAREYCGHCRAVMRMGPNDLVDHEDPSNSISPQWHQAIRMCKVRYYNHCPDDLFQVLHTEIQSLVAMRDDAVRLSSSGTTGYKPKTGSIKRYNELIAAFPISARDTSNPYVRIDGDELDAHPDLFEHIWSKGETLVVTGMKSRFRLPWSPESLAQSYGDVECAVQDCAQANPTPQQTTVRRFFREFGKSRQPGAPILKLKDWPPSEDFKEQFPELFDDFEGAVPMPDVTRRDGVRNIAAHFAKNANIPDLGPKMYIAQASVDSKGSNGSTKLHMDVADAVNIQLHAMVDGENQGCALWHIYSPEETLKLRQFLYRHLAKTTDRPVEVVMAEDDDPIHTQRIYVDCEMRKVLRDEYGVKGWEIRQLPGEAVFIPAYCAHQVLNLADCIKVAADFVSVHSIKRCLLLTEEFRKQTHEAKKPWRSDLLQLRQMLIYAFSSAGRPLSAFASPSL